MHQYIGEKMESPNKIIKSTELTRAEYLNSEQKKEYGITMEYGLVVIESTNPIPNLNMKEAPKGYVSYLRGIGKISTEKDWTTSKTSRSSSIKRKR